MTSDNLLMQTVADVLNVPVVRAMVPETVSLGAAYAPGSPSATADLEGCGATGIAPRSGCPGWTSAAASPSTQLAARRRAHLRLMRPDDTPET